VNRLLCGVVFVVCLFVPLHRANADTYYIYGDTGVGSLTGNGDNTSPFLRLSDYKAIFESQSFVNDVVVLAGTFRESLELDFSLKDPGSKVQIRQWLASDPPPPLVGRPIKRALVRADLPVPGVFSYDIVSGYYRAGPFPVGDASVGRLLYKWDDPKQFSVDGFNTGHLRRKSQFAGRPGAGSLGAYEFHYDTVGQYVYVNTSGLSTNAADYSWVRGFNSTSRSFAGVSFVYGNGSSIEGIEGALWCDDNNNGHTFAAFESTNCVLRNLKVRDAGHHAVAVSNSNPGTPISSCVIEGCEVYGIGGGDFGNAPFMIVAGGADSNVTNCEIRNNTAYLFNPLDPSGSPVKRNPLIPVLIGAISPENSVTKNISVSRLTAIWSPLLSGPDTSPWDTGWTPYKSSDDENPAQYDVRFDHCRWENMNRAQIGSTNDLPRGIQNVSVRQSWFGFTRTGPDRDTNAEPYYAMTMRAPTTPVVGQVRTLFTDCHFDIAFDAPPIEGFRQISFLLAAPDAGAAGTHAIFDHCNFAFRPVVPRTDQAYRFIEWRGRSNDMSVKVKNSIIAWNSPQLDNLGDGPGFRRLFHYDQNASKNTRLFTGNAYFNWNWNTTSQFLTDNNGLNALGVPNFFTTADGDQSGVVLIDRPFLRPTVGTDLVPGSQAAKLGLGVRPDSGALQLPVNDATLLPVPGANSGGTKGGSAVTQPAAKPVAKPLPSPPGSR